MEYFDFQWKLASVLAEGERTKTTRQTIMIIRGQYVVIREQNLYYMGI